MPTPRRHDTGLLPRRRQRARAALRTGPGRTAEPGTDPDPETAALPGHADAAGPAPAAPPPEHPSPGRRRANAYDRYSLLLQLIQVFPVVSAFLVAMVADSVLAFVLAGAALVAATGAVVWAERGGRPHGLTASGTAPPGRGRILLTAQGRPAGVLPGPAGEPAAPEDTVSLLISLHGGTTENVVLHVALPRTRDEHPAPEPARPVLDDRGRVTADE